MVDPEALESGIEALGQLGLKVVRAPNLERSHGLFAGEDTERLDGLHRLAADSSVEAIFFARGGHGLLRLLPGIDWQLLARRPRWFVGYSDLTPFLAQIVERLGWLALHGPMVAVEPARGFAGDEAESLWRALAGDWPIEVTLEGRSGEWRGVEGRLVGGCLTLLSATLGTPWAATLDECVLFLEDVAEPLYRVDRMLQQLKLAGALASVRGIVLGALDAADADSSSAADWVRLVRDAAGDEMPVAWGCPSGHCRPNLTLALGARARVAGSEPKLVLDIG
jgi:muramoyltetrapeptide carboxypeptidase